jgi:hypothetical protein
LAVKDLVGITTSPVTLLPCGLTSDLDLANPVAAGRRTTTFFVSGLIVEIPDQQMRSAQHGACPEYSWHFPARLPQTRYRRIRTSITA